MLSTQELTTNTDLDFEGRWTNYLTDKIQRRDVYFSQLAKLYLSDRDKFNKLKQKVRGLTKQLDNESNFALAAYINYIEQDYKNALEYFLRAIAFNSDNVDNWIDLTFTLRQLGEFQVSTTVLFNLKYVIYYYKYLSLQGCKYPILKNLVMEIEKNAK